MDKNEVVDIINGFLVEEFEIEEDLVQTDATWSDIGIDSLDFVDIVVIIEKEFGFKLKGEDMVNVRTLGQFHEFIYTRHSSDQ
ncbi:MAG: acyl carrier protein [Bacteroidetes bacterium]|nr:MAG: acyl carrier protein [Bacteroidota bacterium]RLD55725.1 MAG: acyl carrier protein [Bacteroidota bacterium]RLD76951.1 MAG: acyl carrier protein [Bacteroidota bacterium]